MTPPTLLINGPSVPGKSRVARLLADHVLDRPAHLLRLHHSPDEYTNAVVPMDAESLESGATGPASACPASSYLGAPPSRPPASAASPPPHGNGWASVHDVAYTPERVFETVPEALQRAHECDRDGFIILEADNGPAIRHAYPYDYRVFVMDRPSHACEVFRDPKAAAQALQQVMQDTASFASEIFGLFDDDSLEDSAGVHHRKPPPRHAGQVDLEQLETLEVEETQVRQFMGSPLGAEIASRIQLQPTFHPLVEADVALIVTQSDRSCPILNHCVDRLQNLLSRIRHEARQHSLLYWGDLDSDGCEQAYQQLMDRLKRLLNT